MGVYINDVLGGQKRYDGGLHKSYSAGYGGYDKNYGSSYYGKGGDDIFV